MEHLATIVFERTPAGAVAIKAADDAVPRQLRTLLLAIDGRSPVSQYVSFLTALAPLSEKFAQLEVMGFARRRSAPSEAAATSQPPSAPAPAASGSSRTGRQVTEAELRELASLLPREAPAAPTTAPKTHDLDAQLSAFARTSGAHGFNDIMDMGMNPGASTARPPPPRTLQATAAAQRPVLANLLATMQAYLSDAAGMEGLPVALMLEQITSLAQLRGELPSYASLVASYGGDWAGHISTLTRMLDDAER